MELKVIECDATEGILMKKIRDIEAAEMKT